MGFGDPRGYRHIPAPLRGVGADPRQNRETPGVLPSELPVPVPGYLCLSAGAAVTGAVLPGTGVIPTSILEQISGCPSGHGKARRGFPVPQFPPGAS